MSGHQGTVPKEDKKTAEQERKKREKLEKEEKTKREKREKEEKTKREKEKKEERDKRAKALKDEKEKLKSVKEDLNNTCSKYSGNLKKKNISTYEEINLVKSEVIEVIAKFQIDLSKITHALKEKENRGGDRSTNEALKVHRSDIRTEFMRNDRHGTQEANRYDMRGGKRQNQMERQYHDPPRGPGQSSGGGMQGSSEMRITVTHEQRKREHGQEESLENKKNVGVHKRESKNPVFKESRQNTIEPPPDYIDRDTESTSKNLSEEYAKAQSIINELEMKNKELMKKLSEEESEVHQLKEELKRRQEVKFEDAKKDSENKDIKKDSNEKEAKKMYNKDNSQNGPNHEKHADERSKLQQKQGPNSKETQLLVDKLKGEYQHEINRLKEDLEKTKNENDWRIRELEAKLQNEEQGKSTLQAQVKKITYEKNEALTRLSEIAGRRLLENNPSIADLSTEIRPTKIGENFKQLYDNEWTEAFEELTEQGKKEEECIKALLRIVQDTFTFAMEEAKSFESKLISIVISFPGNANSSNTNTTKDEEELIKQLKRDSAARTSTAVQDVYVRKIKIKENIGERLQLYARKCMELCWYMAVQSPPMVIVSAVQSKGPFDEKYYSRYTATGDLIDYVVWPCTLLHENGPVLAKGVAQATKDNREAFKRKQAPAAPKQNSDERWSSTKQGAVGQEGIRNPNTKYQKKDEKNKNEQNVYNKTEGGRSWQSDGSSKEKTQMRSKSVYMKSGTMDESSAGGVTRSHSVKNETITDNKRKFVSTIKL